MSRECQCRLKPLNKAYRDLRVLPYTTIIPPHMWLFLQMDTVSHSQTTNEKIKSIFEAHAPISFSSRHEKKDFSKVTEELFGSHDPMNGREALASMNFVMIVKIIKIKIRISHYLELEVGEGGAFTVTKFTLRS